MEFRILGPLEVEANGRLLEIGTLKERTLLALLLLNAGRFVSTDRIVEELWGDSPPPSASKLVQTYVSHLRKVIPGVDRASTQVYTIAGTGRQGTHLGTGDMADIVAPAGLAYLESGAILVTDSYNNVVRRITR